MSKNKYYNEYGNQVRSRPKKRIYKKFSFWFILILSIVIIITIINLSTGKNVVVDDHTASNNEENNDEANDNVDKNEINSDYNNNEQESNSDNNASKQNDIDLEKDLLEDYDQLEIDYARIILMHGLNISDSHSQVLHINDNLSINHSTLASALGNFDFIRNLDLTILRFEYHDGKTPNYLNVYYTPHGDGNITTYQLDEVDLHLDRKVDELEREVLNTTKTMYVEPSEPDIVANFIDNVEFIYE